MSSYRFLQPQRNEVNHLNYYYFTKAFESDKIDNIIKLGESRPKVAAETGGGEDGAVSDYRKSDVSWIEESNDSIWLYDKIAEYAMIANKEMWNFDIWGYHDALQYTLYEGNGGHYDWHADLGPHISNRKLSCVLQLSNPEEYEGGDLQMNVGGQILTVPRERGLLCFFPSFILHRVTPLTGGLRRSLVTWLCGANFR